MVLKEKIYGSYNGLERKKIMFFSYKGPERYVFSV